MSRANGSKAAMKHLAPGSTPFLRAALAGNTACGEVKLRRMCLPSYVLLPSITLIVKRRTPTQLNGDSRSIGSPSSRSFLPMMARIGRMRIHSNLSR